MLLLSFFSWWYGAGWANELTRVKRQIGGVADTFSIVLLIQTLFAPFRQIDTGRIQGSLGVQVRAWVDRLVSRLIGAMIRSFMIVFGVVSLASVSVYGAARLLIWPLLPLLSGISLIAFAVGWLPWKV